MSNGEAEFWAVINNSGCTKSAGMPETLAYCRGTLAHAMDLIAEQNFPAANRKLRNLTYYIDCVAFNPDLQDIYFSAWDLIRMLDEPVDDCSDYLIEFTLPLHLIKDDED